MTDIKYKFIKNRIQNIHVGSVGTSFNIVLMYGLLRIGPVTCPRQRRVSLQPSEAIINTKGM